MSKPVFSPAMLRLFLLGRAEMYVLEHADMSRAKALCAFRAHVRRCAGVTAAAVDQALEGKLSAARERARIWGFLGLVTADHGIRLTDNGKQEAAQ